MNTATSRNQGNVLMTVLIVIALIGVMLAAILSLANQQNRLNTRSQVWAAEIPIAEAGIEEALAHLNSRPTSLASSGWAASTNGFTKTRVLGSGYFLQPFPRPHPTALCQWALIVTRCGVTILIGR